MIFLIDASGTKARRASLISFLRFGFFSGSKQASPSPWQLTQAFRIAFRCFCSAFDPATRQATLSSSFTFQSM